MDEIPVTNATSETNQPNILPFARWLASKAIDADAYKEHNFKQYQEWERVYAQMGPVSFTHTYKFMINPVRRIYRGK